MDARGLAEAELRGGPSRNKMGPGRYKPTQPTWFWFPKPGWEPGDVHALSRFPHGGANIRSGMSAFRLIASGSPPASDVGDKLGESLGLTRGGS
jgi:hypothetical protein